MEREGVGVVVEVLVAVPEADDVLVGREERDGVAVAVPEEEPLGIALDEALGLLEPEDDAEVERIGADYAAGRLLTGDVKARLADTLAPMVLAHQAARAAVTDDVVRDFMRVRALDFVTTDAARAAREAAGK